MDHRLEIPDSVVAPRDGDGVGVQTPRHFHAPDWSQTAGEDVIDLASAIGLEMLPWQKLVLRNAMCEDPHTGKWDAFQVGLVVPRQNGKNYILRARLLAGLFLFGEERLVHSAHLFKALDVDTPILTENGWSTMGELVDGDRVYAPDGRLTTLQVHPIRHGRPCYRLTFDDGQTVVADEDHLWGVTYCRDERSNPEYRVVDTKFIAKHGVCSVVRKAKSPNGRDRKLRHFRVQIPKPLQFEEKQLPIDPWLLGFWLGDGDRAKTRLSIRDSDVPYVKRRLEALGIDHTLTPESRKNRVTYAKLRGLRGIFNSVGVLGNKHVPDEYMRASESQRRELLRGLMDSDGTASKSGSVSFSSMDERLARQVLMLVRSLGEKASIYDYDATLDGRVVGRFWRVVWAAVRSTSPFGLERQTKKLKKSTGRSATRRSYNTIAKIERVESRPTRCITVDNDSKLYCVGHGFVPTHNTAHNEYLEIVRIIEETPEFLSMVKSMPDSRETAIILKDGRRLDFMSRARSGGRGLQGDCVVLDEAFALSQTLVSDLLPVLSSRPSPQVWYTSSTGFDYSETLMAVRKKALDAPEDNKHLAYFEWCADLDEVDWRSREAVQQSNPSFGYLQTWDWIKETELGVMGEEEYQRERLGIWADRSTSAVIGADKWEAALVTGEVLAGAKVVRRSLGLEVTADRDFAVIGGAAELSDGRIVVDVVRAGEGVAWLQDELGALTRKHKPHAGVVVDSFSAASSMANPLGQAGVDVSLASTKDIVAGTAEVFDRLSFESDGVADPQLLHGRDALLDDAAYTARKRLVGQSRTAWTWQQHGEVAVEPLRAITLAVRGLSMEPVRKKRRARVA